MNTSIRTYRIRKYLPNEIENFDKTFFSRYFLNTSFLLKYKGHNTSLKKRKNSDFLIDLNDYKNEELIIFSGNHRLKKNTKIEIENDSNFKLLDSYFIPNEIEFLNFPNKNLFITKANKKVFHHVIKGLEKEYNYEIPKYSVDLRKMAQNEDNIVGVNIKPNTANCDTLVGYGTNVHNDSKIQETIDNPNSFLSNLMIRLSFQSQTLIITITADCGIVIYKWNENLKDDLDIIFYSFNNIIQKYLN